MLTLLEFNQDRSCLAVSSPSSFAIYNCDPFDRCYACSEHSVAIAEMLFSTSLVAIVDSQLGDSSLRIINTKKNSTICELTFPSRVLDIKMNRKRIAVVLTNQILIYDVSCMKLLKKIELTIPYPNTSDHYVACDLSPSDLSVLAFQQFDPIPLASPTNHTDNINTNPDDTSNDNLGTQSGNVVVYDALHLKPICIVNCHKSRLQKLTLSENGVLLATTSIKGTIIRIFNAHTGIKMYEFRRGSMLATICSLTFNQDNTILACSSDTGTVHFFSVPDHISQMGVSKELSTSALLSSTSTPTPTLSSSPSPPSGSSSNDSPQFASKSKHNELPLSSTLTNEESEEVNRLMDSADNATLKKSSTLQKTKRLTSFLWSKSKQYLPQQINAMLEPKRDFAFIKLPAVGSSVIGLLENTCYIATTDGLFLQYTIPAAPTPQDAHNASASSYSPVECKLVKHHQIPLQ